MEIQLKRKKMKIEKIVTKAQPTPRAGTVLRLAEGMTTDFTHYVPLSNVPKSDSALQPFRIDSESDFAPHSFRFAQT